MLHQYLLAFACRPSKQKTLTVWGYTTLLLVSSFTSLDLAASLHKNDRTFSCLVKSNLAELETSHTVILPPSMSVLWSKLLSKSVRYVIELLHVLR